MNVNVFSQILPFVGKYINQSNTRHLSWMKQFGGRVQSEIITPMGANVPPLVGLAFNQFMAAENHEDDCYIIIVKSEKTDVIADLDKQRDTKYVGVKSMCDALSRIGSAEQQQYAKQLIDLVTHYKVDIAERYDDETTKMDQLLQELTSETWTTRIAALGLTATVGELASINQQMKQLINERNDELSTITPQAMVQARAASDEAYVLLVTVINAMAIAQWADGSSPYDQAILHINQDQDYYMKNVFYMKPGSGSGSQQGGQQGGSQQGGSGTAPENGGGTNADETENGGGSEQGGGSQQGGSGDDSGTTPPSGGGGFPGSDEIDDQNNQGGSGDSNYPPSGGGGFGG